MFIKYSAIFFLRAPGLTRMGGGGLCSLNTFYNGFITEAPYRLRIQFQKVTVPIKTITYYFTEKLNSLANLCFTKFF